MWSKTRRIKFALLALFAAFTLNFFLLVRKELQAFVYHPFWVWHKNLQIYFLQILLFLIIWLLISIYKK